MVIQLQPEDELNTIIHRIQEAPASPVTLVVPSEGAVLRDPLTWQMVAEYARRAGKQLLVQAEDPAVGDLVRRAGLDVLAGPSQAAAGEEEDSGARGPVRRAVDVLAVLLLAAAACLTLVYFAVPKVTVIVTPAVQPVERVLLFPLDALAAAQPVEAEFALTRRTAATGRKVLGTARAVGEVVLINQGREQVLVPRGTIVSTASDTLFQITADVTVPGITAQYFMGIPVGIQAGQAVAPIEAVLPGSGGNVAAGRVERIAGFDLDVRNPEPTRGGQDTVLQASTAEDVERARQLVERGAEQEVLSRLREKLESSSSSLLVDTVQVGLEWAEATPVGEETHEVLATAQVKGRGYALNTDKFASAVELALQEVLPPGWTVVPHTVRHSAPEVLSTDDGPMLQVMAAAASRALVSPGEVAPLLVGAAVSDLERIAEAIPAAARLEVRGYEGEYLPRLKRWLQIEVEEPTL